MNDTKDHGTRLISIVFRTLKIAAVSFLVFGSTNSYAQDQNLVLCRTKILGMANGDSSSVSTENKMPTPISKRDKALVILAGKPSHGPRVHEFNAGAMLLKKCLTDVEGLSTTVVKNGWPADESVLESADAIVFYMDGGRKHEVIQKEGRRLKLIDKLAANGVGIGFMHYGVDIDPEKAGEEFKRWIGGHYETMFSCNPIWEPNFSLLPDHPVTRGVKPFKIKDEWYFNMRFIADIAGNEPVTENGTKFVPILVASPGDAVREGPYVHPKGPYKHIVASKGRAEAMLWTVERTEGGRGFGFTGGHYHDNWQEDNFRKVVMNTMLWIAQVDVPADGVNSSVSPEELEANLDPKKPRKKKKIVKPNKPALAR